MAPGATHADHDVAALLVEGRRAHRDGDLAQALACYQAILARRPGHADALYLAGLVAYRRGDVEQAMALARRALVAEPGHALAHASLGQMLQDHGDDTAAVDHFRRALEVRHDHATLHHALGLSLMRLGDGGARACFERAIALDPVQVEAHLNRANLDRREGREAEARRGYQHVLSLDGDCAEAHNNLGVLDQQRRRLREAAAHFRRAIALRPGYAEAHNNLGAVLNEAGDRDAAADCFRRATRLAPGLAEARVNAVIALHQAGHYQQAEELLAEATRRAPDDALLAWCRCHLRLRPVYASDAERVAARTGFRDDLHALAARLADHGDAAVVVERGLSLVQPFALPYQGGDDLPLLSVFGDLVVDALGGAGRPLLPRRGRMRVGIVSAFFQSHANWRIPLRGWLRSLAGRFEVIGYHTGVGDDRHTAEARSTCHRFREGLSLAGWIEAIDEDRPDVLIYPEIGMNPRTTMLAARRLAPLQCVSWGHPVTSGLPTMDVFLGSAWMDDEGGAGHYRESLLRLPGLSCTVDPPEAVDARRWRRADFGLADDDVVVLCAQNLSKYLPAHDALLAAIAVAVPRLKLVFLGAGAVAAGLQARLGRVLDDAGVEAGRVLHFLPRQSRARFLGLHQVADLALDTPLWSGCNTVIDALACDLPVVTWPGPWLRSRHAEALYRQIGLDTLVARDADHYVSLAVALARDPAWRAEQRCAIAGARPALYGDDAPARALGDFLAEAVSASRA